MCVGIPSAPTPPPPPPRAPEAARTPETRSGETAEQADARRRRAATGDSARSTILTGPRGVQNGAETAQKTLLGQ